MNLKLALAEKYILVGHEPKEVSDLLEWGRWFETAERHVGNDKIGNVRVSTVFLGLEHNFGASGPPIVFETMVFGGKLDGVQERYCTWEQAEKGHAEMLTAVREAEK